MMAGAIPTTFISQAKPRAVIRFLLEHHTDVVGVASVLTKISPSKENNFNEWMRIDRYVVFGKIR